MAYLLMTSGESEIVKEYCGGGGWVWLWRIIDACMAQGGLGDDAEGFVRRCAALDRGGMVDADAADGLAEAWRLAYERVPDLRGPMSEQSFEKVAQYRRPCSFCGEPIEAGELFVSRPDPYPATRHIRCNRAARSQWEYKYVGSMLMRTEEMCGLFASQGYGLLSINATKRYHGSLATNGYMIDAKGRVTSLPRMGEFISDYVAGTDDFELIRRYPCFLSYLVCFLSMRGYGEGEIRGMGAGILDIREGAGGLEGVRDRLMGTQLSDFFYDEFAFRTIDAEAKGIVLRRTVEGLLDSLSRRASPGTVTTGWGERTFSVGGAGGAELDISFVDGRLVCRDASGELPFEEYFDARDGNVAGALSFLGAFME